jgi:hypothetical protein
MTQYQKQETIPIHFWMQVAADTDLICSLCHHFQQLSAQGITGKMPGCLLEALQKHCKTGTGGNNTEETSKVSGLLPEGSG